MRIEIEGADDLIRDFRALGSYAESAFNATLRLTTLNTRAELVRRLGGRNGHLYLSAKTIRNHIDARYSRGNYRISVSSKPLPVKLKKEENAYKGTKLKRGCVKVYVRRDKGPETFRHAFAVGNYAALRSKKGAKGYRFLHGPSIAVSLDRSGILEELEREYIPQRYLINAQSQIKRFE